jgi:hypothetical protein
MHASRSIAAAIIKILIRLSYILDERMQKLKIKNQNCGIAALRQ